MGLQSFALYSSIDKLGKRSVILYALLYPLVLIQVPCFHVLLLHFCKQAPQMWYKRKNIQQSYSWKMYFLLIRPTRCLILIFLSVRLCGSLPVILIIFSFCIDNVVSRETIVNFVVAMTVLFPFHYSGFPFDLVLVSCLRSYYCHGAVFTPY